MIEYSDFPLLEEDDVSESAASLPNYLKIYDIIYNFIYQGKLASGDVIPSENTLASHWNVSRGTVRMAMRKLEEDGYINKTQGKQAVVATFANQTNKGLHWIYNLSIENCLDTIDEINVGISIHPCNKYIARELGYDKHGFLIVSVSTNYFAKGCHVSNSVTIFDAQYLEEFKLDINNSEMIKRFITEDIFQNAKRSKTIFNVLRADEDDAIKDLDSEEPVIVFEEIILGENDRNPIYCKHRLKGSKYRFLMERKAPM